MLPITFVTLITLSFIKANAVEQTLKKTATKISICIAEDKTLNEEEFFTNEIWKLEIPKINLEADINYGTTEETMNKYIGHFDETKFWNGNIGLAAHNRGYPVNYFGKLKELTTGDEIIYTTVFGIKKYKVEIITKISDTDWSYLENTKDNRITLITCVENEPSYRRCIQGVEI